MTMTEQSLLQKKRPNWLEFVVDEISFVDIPAVQDASVVALKRGNPSMAKGDEQMDVIDADVAQTIVIRVVGDLLQQIRQLTARVERIVTGIMPPPQNDPFGASVRNPDQPTRAEVMAAAKRLERDPFGAAVLEKRPPLVPRYSIADYLDRKKRR